MMLTVSAFDAVSLLGRGWLSLRSTQRPRSSRARAMQGRMITRREECDTDLHEIGRISRIIVQTGISSDVLFPFEDSFISPLHSDR